MALTKTEKGRALLQQHSATLSLAERRALILCDGKRNRDDVVALLGPAALTALKRLVDEGYLSAAGVTPPRLVSVGGTSIAPKTGNPAVPAPMPARTTSRRSLAASKMYLIDMLQLQRDPESVSLRAQIHTSPSEDELVYRMMLGLRHVQAVATASYARRIGDRLAEILPEQYLVRLDQTRSAWIESMSAVA
ncbi:hypothetical protein [Lysobacter tyrosinilyticus]